MIMNKTAVTVKQLNLYLKSIIESDARLAFINVTGELSNLKSHYASGHLYFTLKDDSATLKCVMFKGNASRLNFVPTDGMKVICTGRISVYERDGVYQLYVENMTADGQGDLLAKYEQVKQKLESEGLFDKERKRPLPRFPKKLAVITSETGAAIKDIFNVLSRRYPLVETFLIPATVQGEQAPASLISALDKAYKTDAQLIIIGRGGGSAEDLWCFNDETLVRKVASSPIPIISAVGHEIDFTLCDFAADLRAPTPSAAAELAVPDSTELSKNILFLKKRISDSMSDALTRKQEALDNIKTLPIFTNPAASILVKRNLLLDALSDRIRNSANRVIFSKETAFAAIANLLCGLNPLNTLARGYAIPEKQGTVIASVKNLSVNDKITLRMSDGSAECSILEIKE